MDLTRIRTKSLIPIALLFMSIVGCGPQYDLVEIKDFRIAVLSTESTLVETFRRLVELFNQLSGFLALTFTYDSREANSTITVIEGMELRDGKVGYGSWTKEEIKESPSAMLSGSNPQKKVIYTMNLEFDRAFIASRIARNESNSWYDLEKLFFHEAGHGHGYGHAENPQDVMYKDIDGEKDLSSFFRRVKEFHGR